MRSVRRGCISASNIPVTVLTGSILYPTDMARLGHHITSDRTVNLRLDQLVIGELYSIYSREEATSIWAKVSHFTATTTDPTDQPTNVHIAATGVVSNGVQLRAGENGEGGVVDEVTFLPYRYAHIVSPVAGETVHYTAGEDKTIPIVFRGGASGVDHSVRTKRPTNAFWGTSSTVTTTDYEQEFTVNMLVHDTSLDRTATHVILQTQTVLGMIPTFEIPITVVEAVSMTVNSPTAGSSYTAGDDIAVSWSISGGAPDHYQLAWYDSSNTFIGSSGSVSTTSYTLTNVPATVTLIRVTAQTAGDETIAEDDVNIVVSEGSLITIDSPLNNDVLTEDFTVTWSGTPRPSTSTLTVGVLDIDDSYSATRWVGNLAATVTSQSFTGVAGGNYLVQVYEYDVDGNEVRKTAITVSIPVTGVSSITLPSGSSYVTGGADPYNINVILDLKDDYSGNNLILRCVNSSGSSVGSNDFNHDYTSKVHNVVMDVVGSSLANRIQLRVWNSSLAAYETKLEVPISVVESTSTGSLTAQTTQITASSNQVIENLDFNNFGNNDFCIYVPANTTNVTIRNCVFRNSVACIKVENGSHNINVHGNLFHDIGKGIDIRAVNDPRVHHNTFTRFGVYCISDHTGSVGWSGNAIQLNGAVATDGSPNIYENVIDMDYGELTVPIITNNNGQGTPINSKGETVGWLVDAISLFHGNATGGSFLDVENNYVMGIKGIGTQAGGGITMDAGTEFTNVENNFILNFGQFGHGSAKTTGCIHKGNRVLQEVGHAVDGYQGDIILAKHPSDGANSDGGHPFVFTAFDPTTGNTITCADNIIENNDWWGQTYWGVKAGPDYVMSAGGTVTADNPSPCTNSQYINNNVSTNISDHPNLTALKTLDPFNSVAKVSSGYFDRSLVGMTANP